MAIETEVRFLVKTPPLLDGIFPERITQGYLSTDPARTVRIRQRGDAGFITIKGLKVGASAPEFEYAIPPADLPGLLALCGEDILTKDRYKIPGPDGHLWELDIFTGRHAGLMIAELELPAEDTPYIKPDWVGAEITTDARYSNGALACRVSKDPYPKLE
jgi:CYTH domain-containing protein